jgi:hypothetical protein
MNVIGILIVCGFWCPFLGMFVGTSIFGFAQLANRLGYVLAYYIASAIVFGGLCSTQRLNDTLFGALCVLGFGGWPLGIFACCRRRRRRRRRNICTACGYDLRVPTDLCPECGAINEEVRTEHVAEALRHVEQLPELKTGEETDACQPAQSAKPPPS